MLVSYSCFTEVLVSYFILSLFLISMEESKLLLYHFIEKCQIGQNTVSPYSCSPYEFYMCFEVPTRFFIV